jgi:hypothetical protein
MAVVVVSKGKRGRYVGALAAPVVRGPPPLFWGAVTPERLAKYRQLLVRHDRDQEKEIERQLSRKFLLLFDHYGIKSRRNARALAWALACEHVMGFQVVAPAKRRGGRRLEWDATRLETLLNTVKTLRQKHPNFTDRDALKFMIENEPHSKIWVLPMNRKGSKAQWLETLESRLQEAKQIEKRAADLSRELQEITEKQQFRE